MPEESEILNCNFCGKSQYEVRKLVAGPNVYICVECIDVCIGVLNDDDDLKLNELDMPNLASMIQLAQDKNK